MRRMLIEIRHAIFGYESRPVVRADHLAIQPARCLGIFGPNGSGKTTLVRGLTGLLPPLAGRVLRPLPSEIRFGYLPQHRALELHWPMTGFDAAAMATSATRRLGWIGRWLAPDDGTIRESMRRLNVDSLTHRPFAKLSGGQQQRLLLAGALAPKPNVLVLDEPTDGLDVQSRRSLLDLLTQCTARGVSTVIISHEIEDLLQLCHEVAWVHPSENPGDSSTVELITPTDLADRMLQSRRSP
jgi:ABC-type Mn2+/Zn2+ transport system ATPase subunit